MAMASLVDRDLAVFWHPCSQMRDYGDFPPLEVASARGARLTLGDGRVVLDAVSSWWCKSLGHGHPGVRARIEAQLDRFEHVIAANTTNRPLVELCERLLRMANGAPAPQWGPDAPTGTEQGGHFGKVFLADNGSTAVEIALKMAVQAHAQRGQPQRTRFAALDGGYHGETVGALSVGDLGLYAQPYQALMFPVAKLGPLPVRSGPDDPRWLDASEEWPALEAALAPLIGTLAAVIYEPVLQAAGGMRLYSPDLLVRLRRWADAHGVYLIADEIAAGMGRLGTMLASHLAPAPRSALPDFALLSKGLTAGFLPLSAVLTTNEIFACFDGDWAERRAFLHSNTHTGNALGIAAALGALDAYATEEVLPRVAVEGARLRALLAGVVAARATLAGMRGCGMVAAVDLRAADGGVLEPARRTGYRVYREAVARGALLRPLGDTLYLCPPLNTPAEDLDRMVAILAASVDAVLGRGPAERMT
ncbi:MAG TPA: aminotransferase class III-fold pyridoxal phosphate-dependent enzyme [Polyangia bacterium]|jgi:adenosylmethionine-8-amino-7-oxononanoate aminotransferase